MSGVKNKDFIVVADSKLEKRPVTFGKAGTAATMLCVCHSPKDDLCFTGSDTGLVYVWQGTTLYRSVQAHKGAVCAMYSLSQSKQQVWCFKLAHFDHSCLYSIPVPHCRKVLGTKFLSFVTILTPFCHCSSLFVTLCTIHPICYSRLILE